MPENLIWWLCYNWYRRDCLLHCKFFESTTPQIAKFYDKKFHASYQDPYLLWFQCRYHNQRQQCLETIQHLPSWCIDTAKVHFIGNVTGCDGLGATADEEEAFTTETFCTSCGQEKSLLGGVVGNTASVSCMGKNIIKCLHSTNYRIYCWVYHIVAYHEVGVYHIVAFHDCKFIRK